MKKENDCRFCKALDPIADEMNVVEVTADGLKVGGKPLSKTELNELRNEVEMVKKFRLWHLLTDTAKAQAVNLGMKQSKDFDQLIFAKAMLHVVGINESVFAVLEREFKKEK
jgi:hypothetical protein